MQHATPSAPASSSSDALLSSPLLQQLDRQLASLRAQLEDVARTAQAYHSGLEPALEQVTARAHADILASHRDQLQQRSDELRSQKREWEEQQAPTVKESLTRSQQELEEAQKRSAELQRADAELSSAVTQLSALEASASRSSRPAPSTLAALPLPALRSLLRFLTKADLAHLCCCAFSWRQSLDRGSLWGPLTVRAVTSIVAEQKKETVAAEARRKARGGLPEDFQSANFLVCTAPAVGDGIALPAPPGSGSTNSAAPSLLDPPPLAQHYQVSVSFTQAPSSAASNKKTHNGPAGSALGKSAMFSAALRALQVRSVDVALSEFEDASLRQSAHQRTVDFLQRAQQAAQHRVGEATLRLGSEVEALRRGSEEKDALARSIAALEQQLSQAQQAAAEQAATQEAHRRDREHADNLRRTLNDMVAQSLPAESAAHEEAVEAAADGMSKAGASPLTPRSAAAAQANHQAEEVAAGVLLLKQQKKVLVKAVRSMQAELESTRQEREEYESKLAALKAKIAAVQL